MCACQVSSVGVSQNKWHDNRGEITPDLYIHPHQAMPAFALCKKRSVFLGRFLSQFLRTHCIRGGGATPTQRTEQQEEEERLLILLICSCLSPCASRVGCQK